MSVTITRDEWLSEFERVMAAPRKGDPGLSAFEIASSLGVGDARVHELLRQAFRAGRLTVGRKTGVAIDGRRIMVPCYQLAAPTRQPTRHLAPTQKAAKKR